MSLFPVILLLFLRLPRIGKGYRQLKWGSQEAAATPPTDSGERPRDPTWRPPRVRSTTWRPPKVNSKQDYISFDILTCVNMTLYSIIRCCFILP